MIYQKCKKCGNLMPCLTYFLDKEENEKEISKGNWEFTIKNREQLKKFLSIMKNKIFKIFGVNQCKHEWHGERHCYICNTIEMWGKITGNTTINLNFEEEKQKLVDRLENLDISELMAEEVKTKILELLKKDDIKKNIKNMNNRLIKFRAWNKEKKQMVFNQFVISAYGNIMRNEPAREWHSWKNEDWILMQFTGLKDKNRKEIWEGDIVIDDEDIKWEVKWDFNQWTFRSQNTRRAFVPDSIEVIGDIYENLELLK